VRLLLYAEMEFTDVLSVPHIFENSSCMNVMAMGWQDGSSPGWNGSKKWVRDLVMPHFLKEHALTVSGSSKRHLLIPLLMYSTLYSGLFWLKKKLCSQPHRFSASQNVIDLQFCLNITLG
jgi:hypothetical protein